MKIYQFGDKCFLIAVERLTGFSNQLRGFDVYVSKTRNTRESHLKLCPHKGFDFGSGWSGDIDKAINDARKYFQDTRVINVFSAILNKK